MLALRFVAAPLALGLVLTAVEARAVTVVLGGGLAVECYSTAETADPNEAFEVCSRALQDANISARDKAATFINRSVIRLRVRDYNGAIDDVDQSIARWPSLSEAYVNRGAALLNLERPQEAMHELNRAIEMGLTKVHLAYYNRAMAKEQLNDVRGAYADLKRAAELQPDFVLATEQLKRFTVVGGVMRMN